MVGRLDPDAVPFSEACDVWAAFDAVERLAVTAKILLARRVEDAGAWKREGSRSPAEQMAKLAGTSSSATKRMLETSKRVRKLPKTASAMRKGKLSGAKADAIADAAAVTPDAEDGLLDGAQDKTLADVREACLRAKATDRDAADARIHRERRLTQYQDGEGAWNVHARGTTEVQAEFNAVHEPLVDELFSAARAAGRNEPRETYAFDAFREMVRRADNTTTTDPDRTPGNGSVGKRPPAPRMGNIRVDLSALRRGKVEGDEVCEIKGVGPVPVRVARELLGDAILKLVITIGVDVVNVTHLGRAPTVAQQAALWWASPQCTVSGCNRTRYLRERSQPAVVQKKHTRLDELERLCTHHHDLKTNESWALTPGTG
jgi:hypothetical protein